MEVLNKISSKKRYIFLFILILTILSSITLFLIPGMSRGHDLPFHLARIQSIYDNLCLGKISSIYPNYLYGYGYGNNLFYPDLFLYIPALLKYIGLNLIDSYKIFIFLINFASILSMYISVKHISKNKSTSLVSALIYGLSSYRLIDMYTRAALGETLAFIFAPIIIYGIYEIIYGDYKKFYYLVIGMSGLILSHLLSTYMIIILLIIICIINIKKLLKDKKRILYIILSAGITILLTSYFIIPMLEQMLDTKFAVNSISSTLASRTFPIWSLFIEFPYYFTTSPWIPAGIGITFLISIIYFFKNYKKTSSFTKICYILGIVFLLITTNLFPWSKFENIMAVIQFPWRFLYITTVLLSIGTGLLLNDIKDIIDKKKIIILIVTAFIPLITIIYSNHQEKVINSLPSYEISYGEYLPEGANMYDILKRGIIIKSSSKLDPEFVKENTSIIVKFENNQDNTKLEFPLLYYKGYQGTINNEKVKVNKSGNGLVEINIDENIKDGIIEIEYKNTNIKNITSWISLATLIIFTTYVIIKKRGENNEEK